MLIYNIINMLFLYLAYISYIERHWVLGGKQVLGQLLTLKIVNMDNKYVWTVTEITFPTHKLHSVGRW